MESVSAIPISALMRKQYPLAALTTIRIGGHAKYFAPVTTITQLQEVVTFSQQKDLPLIVLGHGSNVLIDDKDLNAVVIKLQGDFEAIAFNFNSQIVIAGAGASLMKLGHQIAKNGYLGGAYMGVIPGTVGGAVRMNAGMNVVEEIKNHFLRALILDPETNDIRQYLTGDMAFGYRCSALSNSKKIILRVAFNLPVQKQTSADQALHAVQALQDQRHRKHPQNPRTFGSTFKNPPNSEFSAGWYLEKVGMKGMCIGGAMVAWEHANWILNQDNATSSDVKKLIEVGQKRVFEEFGVQLEREVVFLPDDIC